MVFASLLSASGVALDLADSGMSSFGSTLVPSLTSFLMAFFDNLLVSDSYMNGVPLVYKINASSLWSDIIRILNILNYSFRIR